VLFIGELHRLDMARVAFGIDDQDPLAGITGSLGGDERGHHSIWQGPGVRILDRVPREQSLGVREPGAKCITSGRKKGMSQA
jgi:hypothetical protein